MTPNSRNKQRRLLQEYKAEVLEGVAQWVEQLEVGHLEVDPVELLDKIVRHIRETKQ